MDAYRAVVSKRDTRDFADKPVGEGVRIGHPAPSSEEREPSPRLPLDELVHWGRGED